MTTAEMMTKNYLVAGFNQVSEESFKRWTTDFEYTRKSVSESTLGTDLYANVENSANVKLKDDDEVYIDRFGRVDCFVQDGRYYVIAYS